MNKAASNASDLRKIESGKCKVLITHGILPVPEVPTNSNKAVTEQDILTLVTNCMYYGFLPSLDVKLQLSNLDSDSLACWWSLVEPVLDSLTGRSSEASKHIVYKNFPTEVLTMSETEYWDKQIKIYFGAPVDEMCEEVKVRPESKQNVSYKVLQKQGCTSLADIGNQLFNQSTKWSDSQHESAQFLYTSGLLRVPLVDVPFRENAINLAKSDYDNDVQPQIEHALDVLRLAALMSGVSIRVSAKTRFRNFTRGERRMFLSLLEDCKDLKLAASDNKTLFKKFIGRLHPHEGVVDCPWVISVHDSLYRGEGLVSSNSKYMSALNSKDKSILEELAQRPSVLMRKLTELYMVFGVDAINTFCSVTKNMTTMQLLEIRKYVESYNTRKTKLGFPNSSWDHPSVHPVDSKRTGYKEEHVQLLSEAVGAELERRLLSKYPEGLIAGIDLDKIYLPTNDIQLAPFGRGTRFPIPENTKVIRSNTFWAMGKEECHHDGSVWYDNGWSMFDGDFQAISILDWCSVGQRVHYQGRELLSSRTVGAEFSGDPCSNDSGTQVIDLDLRTLEDSGVQFAVWTVLSYASIPFREAGNVTAGVQFVETPVEGEILDPSKCQLSFDLKSNSLSTMLCVVDIQSRELIFLDAPCSLTTHNVLFNLSKIEFLVPSILEYTEMKPTLGDLLPESLKQDGLGLQTVSKVPTVITYTDKDEPVRGGAALVFNSTNELSEYSPISLQDLLAWSDSNNER